MLQAFHPRERRHWTAWPHWNHGAPGLSRRHRRNSLHPAVGPFGASLQLRTPRADVNQFTGAPGDAPLPLQPASVCRQAVSRRLTFTGKHRHRNYTAGETNIPLIY